MTDFALSDPPSPGRLSEADPHATERLALFGHDLRAALSDVLGGLRLIDPDALTGLTGAQIARVRVAAEGLAQLLDHGLAELLGEGPTAQPAQLDLQQFLTDIDLRWSGRGLETGTGFSLHRAADLPVALRVDRVTLDRVVSNLIGNAFKHAARGRVRVEATRRPDGGLRLTVRDDGPGFPDPVLVGPPVLHSRPAGLTGPGSGMGLPIVGDLMRRLDGQLTLHNPAGGGAEAVVDLPPALSQPEAPHRDVVLPLLAGRRVLLADDNLTSRSIAKEMLRALGATVVEVGDGVEAMGRLEREAFDLMLVDVQMPRLSGLDVIRALRALPGDARRMPVIAVTGYGLLSDRRALMAVGADDVLTKPLLCPHAFADCIRRVMDSTSTVGNAPASPPNLAQVFEEDRLQRLLDMAGPETGRDLLDRLISDLEGVRGGLTDAATGPDWAAIRSHSHVLISLAGAVGGLRLQAGAEALNQLAHRADTGALGLLLQGVLRDLAAMITGVEQVRCHHAAPA